MTVFTDFCLSLNRALISSLDLDQTTYSYCVHNPAYSVSNRKIRHLAFVIGKSLAVE